MTLEGAISLLSFYHPRDLRIVRAEGQYVWDDGGRRYLDCHAGHGAAFLGHRNPVVISALMGQASKYIAVTPSFRTEVMESCLGKLRRIVPRKFSKVYFLNSGSEAVELALKSARKATGRKKFLSFINAFHGRTMGALSVTWNPRYRRGFEPFPWDVTFVPFNSIEDVEESLTEEYAAVIVEPVQGEGGVVVATSQFLREVERLCREKGVMLIVDEIQSGFGRTGKVWAYEHSGIKPDMLVAGKSVGGGFPVSFVSFSEDVAEGLGEGDHGSTHGGNPMALAALSAGIEVLIKDDVPLQATLKGKRMKEALERVAEASGVVRNVRGVGLMLGLELRLNPSRFVKDLQDRGLLTIKAGLNVIRFLPPYQINWDDLRFLESTLMKSLGAGK